MKFRVNVYCLTLASHVMAEARPCTSEKFPLGQVQENKAVLGLGTHVYKPLAVCTKASYSSSSSWVFTAHLPADTSCGGELTPPTCPMHNKQAGVPGCCVAACGSGCHSFREHADLMTPVTLSVTVSVLASFP